MYQQHYPHIWSKVIAHFIRSMYTYSSGKSVIDKHKKVLFVGGGDEVVVFGAEVFPQYIEACM